MSLLKLAQEAQAQIDALRKDGTVYLTGNTMSIAAIVAIARLVYPPCFPGSLLLTTDTDTIAFPLLMMTDCCRNSLRVYKWSKTYYHRVSSMARKRWFDRSTETNGYLGANTGFGGSANVRTGDKDGLERSLMQLLQSGVLTEEDKMSPQASRGELLPHAMPTPWVKATMATRVNQCVRGHSALTKETIKAVLQLAHSHIAPITPLR